MEAYKGNGMIYELNKDYHIDSIKCGYKGFHYFESLRDCMLLYNLKENRVFKCELSGNMFDHDGHIHCTNISDLQEKYLKKRLRNTLKRI